MTGFSRRGLVLLVGVNATRLDKGLVTPLVTCYNVETFILIRKKSTLSLLL